MFVKMKFMIYLGIETEVRTRSFLAVVILIIDIIRINLLKYDASPSN